MSVLFPFVRITDLCHLRLDIIVGVDYVMQDGQHRMLITTTVGTSIHKVCSSRQDVQADINAVMDLIEKTKQTFAYALAATEPEQPK